MVAVGEFPRKEQPLDRQKWNLARRSARLDDLQLGSATKYAAVSDEKLNRTPEALSEKAKRVEAPLAFTPPPAGLPALAMSAPAVKKAAVKRKVPRMPSR